ncbi:Thioredoxin domain-containing protein [Plasmodiophora brassicae]
MDRHLEYCVKGHLEIDTKPPVKYTPIDSARQIGLCTAFFGHTVEMDSMLSQMDPQTITAIMSDPDLMRLMSNPQVMAKVQQLMADPSRAAEFMNDPDLMLLMERMRSLGVNPGGTGAAPAPAPIPNPWASAASSSSVKNEVVAVYGMGQFNEIVRTERLLVVVDFTASWCGPCRHIAPAVDSLAKLYAGKAVFLKVDVDKNRDIAQAKRIASMPTFHFYKNGDLVEEFSGANASKLESTVDRLAVVEVPKSEPAAAPSPYAAIPLQAAELATFQQCKFDVVKEKIIEFNDSPDCGLVLNDADLATLSSLVDVVSERTSFHRSTITPAQIDLIDRMIENWKPAHLPPLVNLLRMAVIHPSLHAWLTSANIARIVRASAPSNEASLGALRMTCNLFIRGPLKKVMVDEFDTIHEAIRPFITSPAGPIRLAYMTVLINYAISFLEPKLAATESAQSAKVQLLSICSELLQSSSDVKVINRLVLIVGSLVFRDTTCKSIAHSLQVAETCAKAQSEFATDAQLSLACSEVLKSLNDDDN